VLVTGFALARGAGAFGAGAFVSLAGAAAKAPSTETTGSCSMIFFGIRFS
jgi:hypothetical protein